MGQKQRGDDYGGGKGEVEKVEKHVLLRECHVGPILDDNETLKLDFHTSPLGYLHFCPNFAHKISYRYLNIKFELKLLIY